jgi:pilus assembly protein TadC
MGTTEQELMHAIRALTVILNSGVGLELAMKMLAEGEYGTISRDFGKALTEAQPGGSFEVELKRLQSSTKSRGYRKFLSTLVMGLRGEVNVIESLERMAERENQLRQVEVEKFTETISSRTEIFLVLGILVPIIIITMVFVNTLIGKTIGGGYEITPGLTGLFLLGNLVILAMLTIDTKRLEPVL